MNLWEKIKNIFKRNKIKLIEGSKQEEFVIDLPQMNLEQIDEKSKIFNINDTKFQVIHTVNDEKKYDTTKLEIDIDSKKIIEEKEVYKGQVSWYSSKDKKDINEVAVASSSAFVTFDIDIYKIKNNKEYLDKVMTDLLEKNAVECFRDQGFQMKPQIKCGNYIGGIENETGKIMFDKKIGENIHNSFEMVKERQKFNEIKV